MSGCAATPDRPATPDHYADCDPTLAAAMVEDGALVIEVRDDRTAPFVAGAVTLGLDDVLTTVARERRARCGIVVVSVGGLSGPATAALRGAGYDATDLGEVEAWRHVPRSARDALASSTRPPCAR